MNTYASLRDRALGQLGLVGQIQAQVVAQTALEEAMKFVASHVRIPALIGRGNAVAPFNPNHEVNAITLDTGGFNILTTFQVPDRLYVAKDITSLINGTPYEFLEYHHFVDLQSVPVGSRLSLSDPALGDETPNYSYTLTPDAKLWARPLHEGNYLNFYYRKTPASYTALGIPEITSLFDWILVEGAVIALKEWLREPQEISTLWSLFTSGLSEHIKLYDQHLNSSRKRTHFKIHASYRV